MESDATLLLRILGRATKQQRAIAAFIARSEGLALPELVRVSIEEHLSDYRTNLARRASLTPEDLWIAAQQKRCCPIGELHQF
jgi:hypothetical protein